MRDYWDQLFEKREESFPHEKILDDYLNLFHGKRIVELGAGDGRNSLYLAKQGFNVTAIDYSTVAIEKINSLDPLISTKVIDIEKEKINLDKFNVILFIHYFPSFSRILELIEMAEEETLFFIYTFVKEEVDGNKKTISISYEEIDKLKMDFNVLNLNFVEDLRGKSIHALIKK